tara:strand:- start:504 stop:827 length:324 start_codon:yes stop_codon:yes gene_type:complete
MTEEVMAKEIDIVVKSMLKVMKDNTDKHQSVVDKMVDPLNHISENESFVTSFLSEGLRKLMVEIRRIEDKDERQHFISNGVWELSDGESDYLDMLYRAVNEITEVIE